MQNNNNISNDSDAVENLHLWTHEQSKIKFLHTALQGKEWRAKVYDPDNNIEHLESIARDLESVGMSTRIAQEDGASVLHLHNFGDEARLLDVVREKGLVAGMRHSFNTVKDGLFNAVSSAGSLIKYSFSDPARITGTMYLLGDMLIAMSGSGINDEKESGKGIISSVKRFMQEFTPGEMLQDKLKWFAGMAYIGNSLIQLIYGKDGDKLVQDNLTEQMKAAQAQGVDVLSEEFWSQDFTAGQSRTVFDALQKPLKENPIELASAAALLGSTVGFIGGGYVNMNYWADQVKQLTVEREALVANNAGDEALSAIDAKIKHASSSYSGSKTDIAAGSLSSAGWLARIAPGVRDHQVVGASLHLVNSLTAIYGGYQQANKYQMAGYITYLTGEIAMFFTDRKNYGKESAGNADVAGSSIAKFVSGLPMVLDDNNQQKLVEMMSRKIASDAEKHAGQMRAEGKEPPAIPSVEALQVAAMKELHAQPSKWDALADSIRAVSKQVPASQREAVQRELVAYTVEQPLVRGCPKKLFAAVSVSEGHGSVMTDKPATLDVALKALVQSVPGADKDIESLLSLHDRISNAKPAMTTPAADNSDSLAVPSHMLGSQEITSSVSH